MEALANILSIAGALGAAFYCFTLSARLRRFTRTEDGMRGAVAALSAQVDGMTAALKTAREAAAEPALRLEALTRRSEDAARRLELMLASLHDLGPAAAGGPAVPGGGGAGTGTGAEGRAPARRVLRRRRGGGPPAAGPGAWPDPAGDDDRMAAA